MGFWLTFRVAIRALTRHKLRAGLTVLGVVIGIAAVTTMVSVGQSAGRLVQGEFETLGTNVIIVFPSSQRRGGVRSERIVALTADDADAIAQECPSVMAVSPIVGSSGQIVYGNANWAPRELMGVGPDYLRVRNWPLQYGGFFTERDVVASAKVCVVGHTIVARLFQTVNPIGKTIRIRNVPFRIIGVLERKGANIVGEDQDNVLLLPYTTVRKRMDGSRFEDVHILMASASSPDLMDAATAEIDQLLMDRHKITGREEKDFVVKNTVEIANVLRTVTGILTALIASIAGISLLVGGVGIMNIMLVSVTERTREIGIRMAVGARPTDILRQFLVEAILLSCVGGVVGLLLGMAASAGVTWALNAWMEDSRWPVVVSLPAAAIAIGFATLVGVFFGYYPARQASRLDPIEALRYE